MDAFEAVNAPVIRVRNIAIITCLRIELAQQMNLCLPVGDLAADSFDRGVILAIHRENVIETAQIIRDQCSGAAGQLDTAFARNRGRPVVWRITRVI